MRTSTAIWCFVVFIQLAFNSNANLSNSPIGLNIQNDSIFRNYTAFAVNDSFVIDQSKVLSKYRFKECQITILRATEAGCTVCENVTHINQLPKKWIENLYNSCNGEIQLFFVVTLELIDPSNSELQKNRKLYYDCRIQR